MTVSARMSCGATLWLEARKFNVSAPSPISAYASHLTAGTARSFDATGELSFTLAVTSHVLI